MDEECWGEIPDKNPNIKLPDNINQIAEASIPKEVYVYPENLYFHNKTFTPPVKISDAISCDTMQHTIHLLHHRQDLENIKQNLKTQIEKLNTNLQALKNGKRKTHHMCDSDLLFDEECFAALPEIPVLTITKRKSSQAEKDDFVNGKGKPPVQIDGQVAWKVLWKCVSTILFHTGYEVASDVMLDFLTDVVENRFKKMGYSLARHAHNKPYPEPTVFPDSLKILYQELRMQRFDDILEFYRTDVLGYHDDVEGHCCTLKSECLELQKSIESTRMEYLNLLKATGDDESSTNQDDSETALEFQSSSDVDYVSIDTPERNLSSSPRGPSAKKKRKGRRKH